MGLPEVFLEHRKGEKVQKYLRVKPGRDLFVIGSSVEADLRIAGEGIAGCHAVLRYRSPHWYVCDVSGTESLKVNNQIVCESQVDASTAVEIAGHRLQLFTKERSKTFDESAQSQSDAEPTGALSLHQVVVRIGERVIESKVLGAQEAFKFFDGDTEKELPAPTSGRWTKTEVGRRVIQQRLVKAQEIAQSGKIEIDREIQRPMAVGFVVFMVIFGIMALLSPKQSGELPNVALDKKSMDIIFNAKEIKKKRLESQKVVKSARARAGGTSPTPTANNANRVMPEESTAPKVSGKATAAVNSLRQSGLSSLVGKIAKRANKQGVLVASVGVSADTKGSGRAIFSNGTGTVGGGGSAAKVGPSYRLGGVATHGKAGGVGNFKDGTGLAGASVGTGNIIALIDEETVIEGGLDRDAIAEVIRRNLGQIRYCYERQLSSNPDLYGKVLVKFTIAGTGDVFSPRVDNSTLKSAMVEGCILRRLASWKFPQPKGGTEVKVSYPFLFKAQD